jgi:sporulation protein YlmC with PRC-barrel domain
MDIPLGVDVSCGTQVCGRSTYLVINPVNDRVTHLVVAEKDFPHAERLVPVDYIVESSPTSIRLRCTPRELVEMDSFIETEYIKDNEVEVGLPYEGPYLLWPYGMYGAMPIRLEYEHIPAGEIVIHRGSQVKATDGNIGKVDEFLINPENGRISHLVMREGHLWGNKDVNIPVSEIEKFDDEVVYLKLDKKAVAKLPAIPVHRKWK